MLGIVENRMINTRFASPKECGLGGHRDKHLSKAVGCARAHRKVQQKAVNSGMHTPVFG